MKALLDTCTFLWLVTNDRRKLRQETIDFFLTDGNTVCLSLVSAWEIAIKRSINKLDLEQPVNEFLTEQIKANQLRLMSIELPHVAKVAELPFHHKDPFDRMLIAQSLVENIPILTSDSQFEAYGVRII